MSETAAGYAAAAIAVVSFGTSFLPVKKFETGDGVFFQWVMCAAIFMAGFALQLARDNPTFMPFACLGGVLWATGNLLSVPVIQCIGMGLGLLIWGGANMVMGWASGYFGLFGVDAASDDMDSYQKSLNISGVLIALASMVIFSFVKTEAGTVDDSQKMNSMAGDYDIAIDGLLADSEAEDKTSFLDRLSPAQKRVVGLSGAVIAGCFFGLNFTPPTLLKQDASDDNSNPDNLIDYVFAHFTGIFLSSTVYTMIYAAYQKNSPKLYPKAMLPAFLCGLIWACGQISWFVANNALPTTVTFPIVTTGPGVVASLCGVLLFGEVQGKRNFLILGIAYAATFLGVALITLSN